MIEYFEIIVKYWWMTIILLIVWTMMFYTLKWVFKRTINSILKFFGVTTKTTKKVIKTATSPFRNVKFLLIAQTTIIVLLVLYYLIFEM